MAGPFKTNAVETNKYTTRTKDSCTDRAKGVGGGAVFIPGGRESLYLTSDFAKLKNDEKLRITTKHIFK